MNGMRATRPAQDCSRLVCAAFAVFEMVGSVPTARGGQLWATIGVFVHTYATRTPADEIEGGALSVRILDIKANKEASCIERPRVCIVIVFPFAIVD